MTASKNAAITSQAKFSCTCTFFFNLFIFSVPCGQPATINNKSVTVDNKDECEVVNKSS